MAIGIGNIVNASDYNGIRNKIIKVLGDDGVDPQIGYGRAITSTAKAAGDIIASADMDALYTDLVKARTHQQGTTITWSEDGLNSPDTTEYIGAEAADIGTGGTSADATNDTTEGYVDFNDAADDITTGHDLVGPGQTSISIIASSERTSDWQGSISHTATVTWANADERRYFFNAGGQIRFDAELTGGTSVAGDTTSTPPGTKDEIWQTMLNTMGTVVFGKTTTTSTGSGTDTNYGNYTNWSSHTSEATALRIFTKDGSGVYAENQYYINAWQVSTKSMRFKIVFNDADAGDDTAAADGFPGEGTPIDESITGDIVSNVSARTATGALEMSAPSGVTDAELQGSAVAGYALSTSASSVNEGSNVVVTLDTSNVGNGTNVPYTITGISSDDISGASLTGNFNIQGGTASKTFTFAADFLTEGPETMTLSLNNGESTVQVAIVDTSANRVVDEFPANQPHQLWGTSTRIVTDQPSGTTVQAFAAVEISHESANSRIKIESYTGTDAATPIVYTSYMNYSSLDGTPIVEVRYRRTTESTNGQDGSSLPALTQNTWYTLNGTTERQFYWLAEDSSTSPTTRGLTGATDVVFDIRLTDNVGSITKTSATQSVSLEASTDSATGQNISSFWNAVGTGFGVQAPINGEYGFVLATDGTTARWNIGYSQYLLTPPDANIIDWLPDVYQGTNAGDDFEFKVEVVTEGTPGDANYLNIETGGIAGTTATWYSGASPFVVYLYDVGAGDQVAVTVNLKIRRVGAGTNYDVDQSVAILVDSQEVS
jgi:hypothetical protein